MIHWPDMLRDMHQWGKRFSPVPAPHRGWRSTARVPCWLTSMPFASIVLLPPGIYRVVHRWRKPGSGSPAFIGFAVGRTRLLGPTPHVAR
jgi:hypothetical protein